MSELLMKLISWATWQVLMVFSIFNKQHASPWFQPFCPGFYPLEYIDQVWSLFTRSAPSRSLPLWCSLYSSQDKETSSICVFLREDGFNHFFIVILFLGLDTFQFVNFSVEMWSLDKTGYSKHGSQPHLWSALELQMKFPSRHTSQLSHAQLPVNHKKGCC